uniref:Uncharacterized protein n=1 Tax=Caudovirales sp. ctcLF7 TaxID=2825768 RepID=A0A8S5PTS7_9CAUD|nr:MAG TPA: hypothetical protein [Caudovirales sp. ctcLF7]
MPVHGSGRCRGRDFTLAPSCQSRGKRLRKKKAAGAANTRRRWATPSEF